jgi:hypothetical protein
MAVTQNVRAIPAFRGCGERPELNEAGPVLSRDGAGSRAPEDLFRPLLCLLDGRFEGIPVRWGRGVG